MVEYRLGRISVDLRDYGKTYFLPEGAIPLTVKEEEFVGHDYGNEQTITRVTYLYYLEPENRVR